MNSIESTDRGNLLRTLAGAVADCLACYARVY